MTGNQTDSTGAKDRSLFGSMYASLGIHVQHKKSSESKTGYHPSFHVPHPLHPQPYHRNRGEILGSIIKKGFIRDDHEDSGLQRTASAPESSCTSYAVNVANQSPPGGRNSPGANSPGSVASNTMLYKGFVEIRRQRILGFSWTRVWMIVSPGEIHVVQNIPTSHHVHKLKDLHLSPACCKGNNIFILAPNDDVEGSNKKDVGSKLIFRVSTADDKSAWISALNRAKDFVEPDELSPAQDDSSQNFARRASLPHDFGSTKPLDSVREDAGEAGEADHDHEHTDGERCECCGSPVAKSRTDTGE